MSTQPLPATRPVHPPVSAAERRPVGEMLREWRERRRLSQLALALDAGLSARHLSFLETGRAQPSREMLLRLANKLDIPLRERNRLLVSAGFAPMYAERSLDDPRLESVRGALQAVLAGYEPYPALAVDRHWNILATNRPVQHVLADVAPFLLEPPVNALRLSLHPQGLAPRTRNLAEWRSHMLMRVARQLELAPDPTLQSLFEELCSYPAPSLPGPREHSHADVFVPMRLETEAGEVSLLSTTTVFGTALEVTLSELVIEAFLPADALSGERLRAIAAAIA
ncbi:helix-turn-helix transcriptional regulator [Niveibacterium sp. SC-1]|uniref:helix-turn-helix domain-containing protein n=1 Tax=Niveibacterium sp. SC-1 TaxID=3135646 RepID=UPI00311D89E3